MSAEDRAWVKVRMSGSAFEVVRTATDSSNGLRRRLCSLGASSVDISAPHGLREQRTTKTQKGQASQHLLFAPSATRPGQSTELA